MHPHLRILLLAIGLFLVFVGSCLPIFWSEPTSALASQFSWLHGTNATEKFPKYFQEGQEGGVLRHYDGRFQHGILTDDNRRDTQTHMMRAYLEFSKEHGLETWLAHGTLLGWWWNAKILPWDSDIDVQLTLPSLDYLATHHNQTIYDYSSSSIPQINPPSPLPTETIKRSYLLDINPAYVLRSHANGDNVIDARWVDMRNGLYIDLTAVSEADPAKKPGIWSCKNEHRYRTRELYPLRETLFEGVMTKVPYAYVRVLSEEYQEKALVVTEYEGHRWNATSMLWMKKTREDIKQDQLKWEDAKRRKAAERAKKKAAKEAAKAFKAKGGKGIVQDKPLGDEEGDGMDGSSDSNDSVLLTLEKEPTRRMRRVAVTEELVADLEKEEDVMSRTKRRRERQDVL